MLGESTEPDALERLTDDLRRAAEFVGSIFAGGDAATRTRELLVGLAD